MDTNQQYQYLIFGLFLFSIGVQNGLCRSTEQGLSEEPGEKLIVGGYEAKIGDLPYQVSLLKQRISGSMAHFCGGSIISETKILTAAHCLVGGGLNTKNLHIYHGGLSIANLQESHSNVKNVAKYTTHADYDSDKMINDIAIITLESPLTFDSTTRAIEIATPTNPDLSTQQESIISGWGTTSEGGSISKSLLMAKVPVVTNDECKKSYGNSAIFQSNICAGKSQGGVDTCQGDSGGPLVVGGRLVGITSWGEGCARKEKYGIYTRVSSFSGSSGWISRNM